MSPDSRPPSILLTQGSVRLVGTGTQASGASLDEAFREAQPSPSDLKTSSGEDAGEVQDAIKRLELVQNDRFVQAGMASDKALLMGFFIPL